MQNLNVAKTLSLLFIASVFIMSCDKEPDASFLSEKEQIEEGLLEINLDNKSIIDDAFVSHCNIGPVKIYVFSNNLDLINSFEPTDTTFEPSNLSLGDYLFIKTKLLGHTNNSGGFFLDSTSIGVDEGNALTSDPLDIDIDTNDGEYMTGTMTGVFLRHNSLNTELPFTINFNAKVIEGGILCP